jgi:hypothetical protein
MYGIKEDLDGFFVISYDSKWRSLTTRSFERAQKIMIFCNKWGHKVYNEGKL